MKAPTVEELADFTLKSYSNLLQYLSQTYKIVPFCEIPQKDVPYLILRHDIDISLPAALKMAQIERDLGVRSTYFVLLSSRFYNVLEGNNANTIRQISKLGHEIGLHYHPFQFRSYGLNINDTLKAEIRLLEHLAGRKVYSIARHGPWDRDPFAATKKYINANHPYFRRDLYVHDSCRVWITPEGLFKLLNDPSRKAQLLTHPENWQEDKIDRETLFERLVQSLETEVSTLKRNIKETWLTDPFALKYDRLMKKENSMQLQTGMRKSNPTEGSKLQKLEHYGELFRWYLVNTSWGWQFHRKITKIRNVLRRTPKKSAHESDTI